MKPTRVSLPHVDWMKQGTQLDGDISRRREGPETASFEEVKDTEKKQDAINEAVVTTNSREGS